MAFDAPAPRVFGGRRAEHREEIFFRIALEHLRLAVGAAARLGARGLERLQHRLELHDGRRRHVAALAEAGLHQAVRELALRRRHVADEKPLAREHLRRNEVPVQPLVGAEGERRLLALLGRERAQERVGRGRHRRGRALLGDHRTDRADAHEDRRRHDAK